MMKQVGVRNSCDRSTSTVLVYYYKIQLYRYIYTCTQQIGTLYDGARAFACIKRLQVLAELASSDRASPDDRSMNA